MKTSMDLELFEVAQECLNNSKLIRKTPLLGDVAGLFDLAPNLELYLKMENMQNNGSFKLRGVINQFNNLNLDENDQIKLVTFSAGNYGKAFSFLCKQKNMKGKVLMPETAAESRAKYIQSQGVEVQKYPGSELLNGVETHVKDKWKLVHPLDDLYLIAGYAPLAKEILDDLKDIDLVLVSCGGGSLLGGLSAGLALCGSKALVYGVEPVTAATMKESFERGYPVVSHTAKSIASGLAPPMAGKLAYEHCRKYVNDILLVSDEEIVKTCQVMFDKGLKVEPSGCAAMAALLFNKIPNLEEKTKEKKLKIVVLISGGNITADELAKLFL